MLCPHCGLPYERCRELLARKHFGTEMRLIDALIEVSPPRPVEQTRPQEKK